MVRDDKRPEFPISPPASVPYTPPLFPETINGSVLYVPASSTLNSGFASRFHCTSSRSIALLTLSCSLASGEQQVNAIIPSKQLDLAKPNGISERARRASVSFPVTWWPRRDSGKCHAWLGVPQCATMLSSRQGSVCSGVCISNGYPLVQALRYVLFCFFFFFLWHIYFMSAQETQIACANTKCTQSKDKHTKNYSHVSKTVNA